MIALLAASLAVPGPPSLSQESYRTPPQEIVDIVDAPPSPSVALSPDGSWMLLVERDAMPSLADVARPMLRLAGIRIDPAANGRYSALYPKGIVLREVTGDQEQRIELPTDARIGTTSWSHTSAHFAYTLVGDAGTELWVVSIKSPTTPLLITDRLNVVLNSFTWLPDGESLLVAEVPEDRGEAPKPPAVPSGPNVQESLGEKSPLRTYQDLLSNPHEENLFEHYAVAQLSRYGIEANEKGTPVGEEGIYSSFQASPDDQLILVTRIHHPFSYLMPFYLFPHSIEVWDRKGEKVHTVADVPLAENVPIGGVRLGPRMVAWHAEQPATLVWVEALDGGDPKSEAEHRDRWFAHAHPFSAATKRQLFDVQHRARGLTFLEDPDLVISAEYDRDRRWTRSSLIDLSGTREPVVLEDRSIRDRYGDPGRLARVPNERGFDVLRQTEDWVYRLGQGASPEGLLPFLDRQNLKTLETEHLWRCAPKSYESVRQILASENGGETVFVTSHESTTSPPNLRLHVVKEDPAAEPVDIALTDFADPTPQVRAFKKELLTYAREDGVQLSATLYLPTDYVEGTRLPLLVWAYPIEFNDPKTASQVTTSPWRFTRIAGSSHLNLLTQGYAVLDAATMPIVGDPETMNDTFREQIVSAASAAIAQAVELGVADPDRVGVGGHSYGAFMTANLLAHCDLFRAGVARSGAYNRSLTPFGFQSERRTFWEAPDTYFQVSPFMHAHEINEPLLMIHGEIDNNSGTFPMQSQRMFQAVKGNGGTARLVMLPHESHGYRARESVLHVLAEMTDWFDKYLAPRQVTEAGFEVPAAEKR